MILLSFLGEQPMPALLPLWATEDYDTTGLIPSERTEDLARIVSSFILTDGDLRDIKVLPYFIISPYDLELAEKVIRNQIQSLQLIFGKEICLNLTGGTKMMSIAGMLAAMALNCSMIYVATEKNEIIHLSPGEILSHSVPLEVSISIDQYFGAHGIETSLQQNFNNQAPCAERPPKEGDDLEAFVYQLAVESGYFDDVQRGIFIRKGSQLEQPMIRELDVIVIKNGRLAVCSCKSGRYSPEYLAELEALTAREKFGIYCGKVLASGEEDFSDYRKEEFRHNRVSLVYGNKLNAIAEILLMATEGKIPEEHPKVIETGIS